MSARALPGNRDDSYLAGMMATTVTELGLTAGPEVETGGTANLTTTACAGCSRRAANGSSMEPNDSGTARGVAPWRGGLRRVAGVGRRRDAAGAPGEIDAAARLGSAVRRPDGRRPGAGRTPARAVGAGPRTARGAAQSLPIRRSP